MDYAGLSSLLRFRTDLQKSDLHRFDLQCFPSVLSQPRCPTPTSNPVILWWGGGRNPNSPLKVHFHPAASVTSPGRLLGCGAGEHPGTSSPSWIRCWGWQMGQREGWSSLSRDFHAQGALAILPQIAFQLFAGKESALVLLHKVKDGFYPRECGSLPGRALPRMELAPCLPAVAS